MKQVNLAIVGGSYADETRPYDQQDTVNYLPEQAESDGARSRGILRCVPGFDVPAVSLGVGPIRGSRDVEDVSYHVSGTAFYKCIPTGANTITATNLGTIPGNGRCSLSHNQITGGHEIIIVNGIAGGGYVYNDVTGVLTQITDPDFFGALCVDYLDQYFLLVKPNGDEFYNSDLSAGLSYNSLNTYEAEADPDRIVGLIVNHEEAWIMGRKTIQPFYSSGQLDGLFLPLQGSVIQQGCAGTFAYCNLDNSVFWLDDIGIFRRANGYTPTRISTHPIEQSIIGLDWSQVYCFPWSDRGHQVVYWTFPDGHTWGYDVSSGQWHRRESYTMARWRISTLVFTAGRWLAGDAFNGNLYWLDWNVFAENTQPLISERRSAYQHDNGNKLTANRLELFMDIGSTRTVAPYLRSYPPVVLPPPGAPIAIHGIPPDGVVGDAYTYTWTATGGSQTGYVWAIDAGALPNGTTLHAGTGTVDGTPTVADTFPFVLRVTDSKSNTTTADESILITAEDIAYASNAIINDITAWAISRDETVTTLGGTQGSIRSILNPARTRLYCSFLTSPYQGYITIASDTLTRWTAADQASGTQLLLLPDESALYVINFTFNNIRKYRVSDGVLLKDIAITGAAEPSAFAMTNDGSTIYIAMYVGNGYCKYDTATDTYVQDDTQLIHNSRGIALDPDNTQFIVVHNVNTGNVIPQFTVFSVATGLKTAQVTLPDVGHSIAFHPDGNTFAICNYNNTTGLVWIYDSGSHALLFTIAVGEQPNTVAYNQNGDRLYVTNGQSSDMSVIDAVDYNNGVIATVALPSNSLSSLPYGVSA